MSKENTQQQESINIGALWKAESAKGFKYYQGNIELPDGTKARIVLFPNKEKKKDTDPDARLLSDDPFFKGDKPAPVKKAAAKRVVEEDESDIF